MNFKWRVLCLQLSFTIVKFAAVPSNGEYKCYFWLIPRIQLISLVKGLGNTSKVQLVIGDITDYTIWLIVICQTKHATNWISLKPQIIIFVSKVFDFCIFPSVFVIYSLLDSWSKIFKRNLRNPHCTRYHSVTFNDVAK